MNIYNISNLKDTIKSNSQKLILYGAGDLGELTKFAFDNLNVKVELLDPFKKISNDTKIDNPLKYSIALGLALRGLEK